jgi:hypothetical protein
MFIYLDRNLQFWTLRRGTQTIQAVLTEKVRFHSFPTLNDQLDFKQYTCNRSELADTNLTTNIQDLVTEVPSEGWHKTIINQHEKNDLKPETIVKIKGIYQATGSPVTGCSIQDAEVVIQNVGDHRTTENLDIEIDTSDCYHLHASNFSTLSSGLCSSHSASNINDLHLGKQPSN